MARSIERLEFLDDCHQAPKDPRYRGSFGVITNAKSTTAYTMHAAQSGANRAGPDNADWMTEGWLLTCMMLQVSES